MKSRRMVLKLIACATLFLSACSGGGDGGPPPSPPAATPLSGTFIDSPVQGLGYSTSPSGLSGITDANGQFNYNQGDTVTFTLYGRTIGAPVPASPVVTALTVFNATSLSDSRVINLSQLLLTLAGGAPQSDSPIIIPASPPANFPATLDFSAANFDTSFPGLTLASEGTAATHLQSSFKTLSVTLANNGTVTSNPAGINCTAGTCSAVFQTGTVVTLTAIGTGFTGWSGNGCSGTGPCVVTLNADTTTTATFAVVSPPATLTILPNGGTGSGTVTCSAGGGAFGPCAATYPNPTALIIRATANSGSTFTGWTNGTGNATSCNTAADCSVTLTADTAIRANFTLPVTNTVTANIATTNGGGGTVTCTANGGAPGPCTSYLTGTAIVMTATPNGASNFTGWSNGTSNAASCNSTTTTCTFTLANTTSITANFNRPNLSVTISGTGSVSSNPAGITNCTTTCSAPFNKGTAITLTAGTGLAAWSGGGCTGSGTCVVTLNTNTTVTATFGTPPATMTSPRANHAAVRLPNGKVLITGGFSSSVFPGPALNTVELYDPTTHQFTALTATMKSPRTNHTATLLPNGTVLLAGGQITDANGNGSDGAEIYDPATQTFTAISNKMTVPRGSHVAVLLPNGKVLLAGGFNGGFNDLPIAHNTAELYDPATQTFTALSAKLTTSRADNPAAALLPNGKVLITGGKTLNVFLDNAELYDPTTQTFMAITATMTSIRMGHTATSLPNGTVLVTGGADILITPKPTTTPPTGHVLGSVEIYDPTAQTFAPFTPALTSPRAIHQATLLADGTVLLTGGIANAGSSNTFVLLNTAEIYRP